jgi:hypothetical protein
MSICVKTSRSNKIVLHLCKPDSGRLINNSCPEETLNSSTVSVLRVSRSSKLESVCQNTPSQASVSSGWGKLVKLAQLKNLIV